MNSGFHSLRHLMTRRRAGTDSTISPESASWPSANSSFHGEPAFHSLSQRVPNQYCSMNSGVVSASHRRCGVVRM